MRQSDESAVGRFQQCLGRVNTLVAQGCPETQSFRHLSDHAFPESIIFELLDLSGSSFFQNVENLWQIPEMQEKIHKRFLGF